jgi:hypothetical protein
MIILDGREEARDLVTRSEKYTHQRDQLFYDQRDKGTARIKGQAANDIGE